MMQTATRAKPNAFHFRRQVIILQRAGGGAVGRQFKDSRLSTALQSFSDLFLSSIFTVGIRSGLKLVAVF